MKYCMTSLIKLKVYHLVMQGMISDSLCLPLSLPPSLFPSLPSSLPPFLLLLILKLIIIISFEYDDAGYQSTKLVKVTGITGYSNLIAITVGYIIKWTTSGRSLLCGAC